MYKPILILGGGGHASVLMEILAQQKREILGFVCPRNESTRKAFNGVNHYEHDEDILNFDKKSITLVNGLGSLPGNRSRENIFRKFKQFGYKFETVIANNALVSKETVFEEGVQIFAGAIIQSGVKVEANTIINTGAIIDHDCTIGKNNHIAPGAVLSGHVTTADCVHVGTGASVIQSISICKGAIIGAGATVTQNVEADMVCYPARITQKARRSNDS